MNKTIKNINRKNITKKNITKKNITKKNITKKNITKKIKVFNDNDYKSKDGFLTKVWGPPTWLFLHTISFNYPTEPSNEDKKHYKEFIESLKFVLPCRKCRENLKNNLKKKPITNEVLKNRENFSKYIYELHELINTMLNKKSNLTYEDVRDRYENFRARCSTTNVKDINREIGCVEPLYGHKSKCVIKIVPQNNKCETFQINNKCLKKLKNN